jgi:regulator of protease activity HflC (stomatin/prohibitin superfamily)
MILTNGFIISFFLMIDKQKSQIPNYQDQTAITRDNVTIKIDGVLYFRIVDPVSKANNVTFFAGGDGGSQFPS